MTNSTAIIISLSKSYYHACHEYLAACDSDTDAAYKTLCFTLMHTTRNTLRYYLAGYYHQDIDGFSCDTYGKWAFTEMTAEGHSLATLARGYNEDIEIWEGK